MWLEKTSKGYLVQPPYSSKGAQPYVKECFENVQREDYTTSMGDVCQCSAMLTVKKWFLLFRWNLLHSGLFPLSCVLLLGSIEETLAPLFLQVPFIDTGMISYWCFSSPDWTVRILSYWTLPSIFMSPFYWRGGVKTRHRYGPSNSYFCLNQPGILLTFPVARVHCWLKFNLVSTNIFSAELLSSWVVPNRSCCLVLLLSGCSSRFCPSPC